jgi:membrane protein implicated in regulation of membrane protease activity
MEVLYSGLLLVGLAYLLLMIISGFADGLVPGLDGALDAIGMDTVLGLDGAEATGLGCSVIAVFMAVAGAVGLVATHAGWSLLLVLLVAVAVGMVMARGAAWVLRYVYAGQFTAVHSDQNLIGQTARVTVAAPAGQTGEAMIETGEVVRHAIREVNGEALERGDQVEIVEIKGHYLMVRRY